MTRKVSGGLKFPDGSTLTTGGDSGGLAVLVAKARRVQVAPTGVFAESPMGRITNNVTLGGVSGQMRATLIGFAAGESITSITCWSGTAAFAAGTSPNQWFCVLDSTGRVVALTANDTNAAWAANAPKTLPVTGGPYVIPTTGSYYVGKMVHAGTGGTCPQYPGFANSSTNLATASPALGVLATGLTTLPSIGATLSLSGISGVDYVGVS